jgi:PAS domain S-box-containing protein
VIDGWGKRVGKLITLEDITHRVLAEQESREAQDKLRRSEETYRQLVENINEVVYTIDGSGILTYISPNIERSTGLAPADLVGRHFRSFLPQEDPDRIQQSLDKAMAGGVESFDFRLTDKDGNTRTINSHHRRIEQTNGRITGMQGMLTDVTERIQVEEALQRRASQLSILNAIGEKIAALMDIKNVLDQATQLIQASFGFYHVALFIPDPGAHELIMRSASGAFVNVFPGDHHLKFGQGMVGWVAENGALLLANDVRREPRYMNLYPEKIITRSELAVPVLLGDELVGVLDIQSPQLNAFDENDVRVIKTIANQIAIAIDNARLYEEARVQLTETERKENMLRIQRDLVVTISSGTVPQEMLNIAVETLAVELHVPRVAVFILEAGSGCLNPAALYGLTEADIQKRVQADQGVAGWVARSRQPVMIGNLQEIPGYKDSHADTHSVLCVPLVSGGEVTGIIYLESPQPNIFKADDLRLLVILANNLVVLIERAQLFLEVEQARSVLEERASALEAANERLRELDRMKSQFLANMSHELRTPLNSIIGFSEILIDNLAGPLNADQEDCVNTIHDSGKHLLALINDLLDFSRIEAGRMTLDPSTFEVAVMFDEVRSTILPLTERKAQLLGFFVEENLPSLCADRLRLKQVFINLLSNANKFTPEGGAIKMSCRLEHPGQMLFSFQDNGIGIRPEHQDLIFEEFRQVDGSMSREVAGSGLGLAISKRIVLMHHGSIWVESQLGEGTTFYVRVPIMYQRDMI